MTNFLADFFGKQTEFGPRQVLGHKFCIVPDFYLSDIFLGNYKEPQAHDTLRALKKHLEPLDKGRLSLGDVGDAFRAKRGKNAGFPYKCFLLFYYVFRSPRSGYNSAHK